METKTNVMNSVSVVGTVLRDAEPFAGHGDYQVNFCLKVPSSTSDRMVYVDCVAFASTFDQFDGYLEKDETVAVSGELTFRTWTDKFNEKHTGICINAKRIKVIEED